MSHEIKPPLGTLTPAGEWVWAIELAQGGRLYVHGGPDGFHVAVTGLDRYDQASVDLTAEEGQELWRRLGQTCPLRAPPPPGGCRGITMPSGARVSCVAWQREGACMHVDGHRWLDHPPQDGDVTLATQEEIEAWGEPVN